MGVDLTFMCVLFYQWPAEQGLFSEQYVRAISNVTVSGPFKKRDMDKGKFKQINLYLLSIFMEEK